jgi:hypothetical protein
MFESSKFASADDLSDWIAVRSGVVLDAKGEGGSGTFVQAPDDGRVGLLTATHVVLPSIFTGSLTVLGGGSEGKSIEPRYIRIAPRADAAVLYMPQDFKTHFLTSEEWGPTGLATVISGQLLVAQGVPGAWKDKSRLSERRIDSARSLCLGVKLTEKHPEFMALENTTFKEGPPLPESLGGMSGGGVFDFDGTLVGLIKAQGLGTLSGHLFYTNRNRWTNLTTPESSPLDDYSGQEAVIEYMVRHKFWKEPTPLKVTMTARFFWSAGSKFHTKGEIGNVVSMTVGDSFETRRFLINVESPFNLPIDHTEEERLEAFRQEGIAILTAIGCEVELRKLKILSREEVEEKIKVAAYQLWKERGGPDGDSWKDWFDAKVAIFEQRVRKGK